MKLIYKKNNLTTSFIPERLSYHAHLQVILELIQLGWVLSAIIPAEVPRA